MLPTLDAVLTSRGERAEDCAYDVDAVGRESSGAFFGCAMV